MVSEKKTGAEIYDPAGWLPRSLFTSVLLNLLLIVVLGIAHFSHHGYGQNAAHNGGHGLEMLAQHLDANDAAILHQAYDTEALELKRNRDDVRAATQSVAKVFQEETADPAALKKALDQLTAARSKLHLTEDKIMQQTYEKLSPEGRHHLGDLGLHHL